MALTMSYAPASTPSTWRAGEASGTWRFTVTATGNPLAGILAACAPAGPVTTATVTTTAGDKDVAPDDVANLVSGRDDVDAVRLELAIENPEPVATAFRIELTSEKLTVTAYTDLFVELTGRGDNRLPARRAQSLLAALLAGLRSVPGVAFTKAESAAYPDQITMDGFVDLRTAYRIRADGTGWMVERRPDGTAVAAVSRADLDGSTVRLDLRRLVPDLNPLVVHLALIQHRIVPGHIRAVVRDEDWYGEAYYPSRSTSAWDEPPDSSW